MIIQISEGSAEQISGQSKNESIE